MHELGNRDFTRLKCVGICCLVVTHQARVKPILGRFDAETHPVVRVVGGKVDEIVTLVSSAQSEQACRGGRHLSLKSRLICILLMALTLVELVTVVTYSRAAL